MVFCKQRIAFAFEAIGDGPWSYGTYWESNPTSDVYCGPKRSTRSDSTPSKRH
jgi:hypothetical protein